VPNVTDLENLKKIIPEDELFPIENKGSWAHHNAFNAWGELCWLCPDGLQHFSQTPLDTIEKVIDQSNWLQCEGYKAIFEEARRQAPYCAMAINWCYCEPWINASGNSLITYPTLPKPAYYAVQKSLRPVLFSARMRKFDWEGGEQFTAEIWLLNDSPRQAEGNVDVYLSVDGKETHLITWQAKAEAGKNRIGPAVNVTLPDTQSGKMTLILRGGEYSSEYTLCLRPAPYKWYEE